MEMFRRPRNCTVCTDSLATYDDRGLGRRPKIVVPCGHCFHQECIDLWLTERRNLNVPCPLCNCLIEKVIPCICWEAESCEDSLDDENNAVIFIREKWFISMISIIIVLLDVISGLLNDPWRFHASEILAKFTVMVVGTPAFLYVTYHSLDGSDKRDVEHFFLLLGIGAFAIPLFTTLCRVSFPFPLAVMDGIWRLRSISHVKKRAGRRHELVWWTLVDCTGVHLTRTLIRVYLTIAVAASTPPFRVLYFALILVNAVWSWRKKRFEIIITKID